MKKLLIILNALTITSSTVQLTACKIPTSNPGSTSNPDPTSNPEGIELKKITIDICFLTHKEFVLKAILWGIK